MIVAVTYLDGMLHDRVVPAIERQGYRPRLLPVDRSYQPQLAQVFAVLSSGADVALIDQDVESRCGFLDDLDACPEPLCYHAYAMAQPFDDTFAPFALGHSRFKAQLGRPLLALAATDRWKRAHWTQCETLIVETVGIAPHRHDGDAIHHHRYRQ